MLGIQMKLLGRWNKLKALLIIGLFLSTIGIGVLFL